MEREEFIRRFVAEMVKVAGEPYRQYAEQAAESYIDDPEFAEDCLNDPEECAHVAMSYWE